MVCVPFLRIHYYVIHDKPLTRYGDYMQLPPEYDQNHHPGALDLVSGKMWMLPREVVRHLKILARKS